MYANMMSKHTCVLLPDVQARVFKTRREHLPDCLLTTHTPEVHCIVEGAEYVLTSVQATGMDSRQQWSWSLSSQEAQKLVKDADVYSITRGHV